MYVCMYRYMYIYTYVYIYIHTLPNNIVYIVFPSPAEIFSLCVYLYLYLFNKNLLNQMMKQIGKPHSNSIDKLFAILDDSEIVNSEK